MKALSNTIGLWALGLGAGVLNVLQIQIQCILVVLAVAAVFTASIRQETQQCNALLFVQGQHPVIEHVSRSNGVLSVVEFDADHLAVAVDEGLLVDAPHAFEVADVVGVLTTQTRRSAAG